MRPCQPSPSSRGPRRPGLGVGRLPSLLPWPCSAPRPTAANTKALSEDAPGVRAAHPRILGVDASPLPTPCQPRKVRLKATASRQMGSPDPEQGQHGHRSVTGRGGGGGCWGCLTRALTCSSCTWTQGRAPGTVRLPQSQAPGPAQPSPSPGLGAEAPAAPEIEHDLLRLPSRRLAGPALWGGPRLTLHARQPGARGVPDTWSTALWGGGRWEAASPSPTPTPVHGSFHPTSFTKTITVLFHNNTLKKTLTTKKTSTQPQKGFSDAGTGP